MAKKRRKRITTSDPYDAKRLRIMAALHYDETKDKPNRELARLLGVDETTVRKYRKQFEWAKQRADKAMGKEEPAAERLPVKKRKGKKS